MPSPMLGAVGTVGYSRGRPQSSSPESSKTEVMIGTSSDGGNQERQLVQAWPLGHLRWSQVCRGSARGQSRAQGGELLRSSEFLAHFLETSLIPERGRTRRRHGRCGTPGDFLRGVWPCQGFHACGVRPGQSGQGHSCGPWWKRSKGFGGREAKTLTGKSSPGRKSHTYLVLSLAFILPTTLSPGPRRVWRDLGEGQRSWRFGAQSQVPRNLRDPTPSPPTKVTKPEAVARHCDILF